MISIRASVSPGEVRVALCDGGALQDYALWHPGRPDGVGDIFRARISKVVPAMAGAFVLLPDGAQGFLPDQRDTKILSEGEHAVLRITRAPQGGKGARLARCPAALVPAEANAGKIRLLARGAGPLLDIAALHPVLPIFIDNAAMLAQLRPILGDRISLVAHAFDEALETEIDALQSPFMALPGGLRAQVSITPALTAIDVDLAAGTAAMGDKTQTHLAANRAALPEIARQIRLRNLSGAIFIDFAGLPVRARASLEPLLAESLASDPLKPRLLGFTRLGMAEIVRPRSHPPLAELLAGPHAAAIAALRRAAGELRATPTRKIIFRAAADVTTALHSDTAAWQALTQCAAHPPQQVTDAALPPGTIFIETAP